MASSSASGPVSVRFIPWWSAEDWKTLRATPPIVKIEQRLTISTGQIDREGNPRKVVNCSCVVVKDWGEESQERSILLNYFQTEQ